MNPCIKNKIINHVWNEIWQILISFNVLWFFFMIRLDLKLHTFYFIFLSVFFIMFWKIPYFSENFACVVKYCTFPVLFRIKMPKKQFVAVRFYSNQWEIIPRLWIIGHNTHCYWPHAGYIKILAQNSIAPHLEKWTVWTIKEVLVASGKCHIHFVFLYINDFYMLHSEMG